MGSLTDLVDRFAYDRSFAAAQALVMAHTNREGPVPVDTGNLSMAIRRDNPVKAGAGSITCDFNIDPGEAPYAVYLQTGTGVFGPAGRRITPRVAKALRFQVGGTTVFARSVAGSGKHKGWWTKWWADTAPNVLRRRV